MSRRDQAIAFFKEGYNCAQAVFLAFCDLTGIEKDAAARMASPFGGGFGRQREVCGAVSGMCLTLGTLFGYDAPGDDVQKAALYRDVQELCAEFRSRCGGSMICRELLGEIGNDMAPKPDARTADYYKKRPCAELVGEAADILESYIATHR
ncbi:MAG: C_GCAxxG_C_C family protein [Ruminococcaceae bacterium]|nr:C_GCAxxG_C_C family protein [Oscillospiraceae bacterium]